MNWKNVLILATIFAIALIGIGVWQYRDAAQRISESDTSYSETTGEEGLEVITWLECNNEVYGYSIEYPATWSLAYSTPSLYSFQATDLCNHRSTYFMQYALEETEEMAERINTHHQFSITVYTDEFKTGVYEDADNLYELFAVFQQDNFNNCCEIREDFISGLSVIYAKESGNVYVFANNNFYTLRFGENFPQALREEVTSTFQIK